MQHLWVKQLHRSARLDYMDQVFPIQLYLELLNHELKPLNVHLVPRKSLFGLFRRE